MAEIQLGKGKHNLGIVDTNELNGGIRREQIENKDSLLTIFDKVDKDGNKILDSEEMKAFTQQVEEYAGNKILSKREAKKLLKSQDLKEIDKNELMNFLKSISEISKQQHIKNAMKDQDGKIVIEYENSDIETFNPSDSTSVLLKFNDGVKIKEEYGSNRQLTKRTIVNDSNNTTEITTFSDAGIPSRKTIEEVNKSTTINYNEEGTEESKEEVSGNKTSYYDYVEGQPVLKSTKVDKGSGVQDVTTYEYNNDGTESKRETVTFDGNGDEIKKVEIKNIGTDNEITVTRELVSFGCYERVITENKDGTFTYLYDVESEELIGFNESLKDGTTRSMCRGADGEQIVTIRDDKGNKIREDFNEQNKLVKRTYTPKDQKGVVCEYDGKGNTYITLQPNETLESLARTFGCTQDAIKSLNPNAEYKVGDKLLVPGDFSPAQPAMMQRKSVQEMINDAKTQETNNRKNYYKSLGVSDFSKYGQKVEIVEEYTVSRGRYLTIKENGQPKEVFILASDSEAQHGTMKIDTSSFASDYIKTNDKIGNTPIYKKRDDCKNNKGEVVPVGEYTHNAKKDSYTIIGKMSNVEYYMVRGNDGKLYYADGKLSRLVRPNAVDAQRIYYANEHNSEDGKTRFVRCNDNVKYVLTDIPAPNGVQVVALERGYFGILKDGKIYYDYDDMQAYAIETQSPEKAKTLVSSVAETNLNNAEEVLNSAMDKEGWIGSFVDWCGTTYGSKNTLEKVRKDIEDLKGMINRLSSCKDEKTFRAEFKNIFGQEYDPKALADYLHNQNDDTYKKAFGTKNNIMERVEKYIRSQNQGASLFKGAVMVVATAVTCASGGAGGVAMATVAGTSVALNVTDKATSKNGLQWSDIDDIAIEAATDAAFVKGGAAVTKTFAKGTASVIANRALRYTATTTADMAFIGGLTYATTGGEANWADYASGAALYFTGRVFAGRGKSPKTKTETSSTPTLDNVALQQPQANAPRVQTRASSVRLGKTKIDAIKKEVTDLCAKESVTPKQLAKARDELSALSDENTRNALRRQLDERASSMSSDNQALYDAQVKQDKRTSAERIVNGKGFINEPDCRVLREYVNSTNSVEELVSLRNNIGNRRGSSRAKDIFDSRIAELNKINRTFGQLKDDVHKSLDDAITNHKGLPTLKDLEAHLNFTMEPTELNTLFDKWLKVRNKCGSNRKSIDNIFKDKGLDYRQPKQRLTINNEQKAPDSSKQPSAKTDNEVQTLSEEQSAEVPQMATPQEAQVKSNQHGDNSSVVEGKSNNPFESPSVVFQDLNLAPEEIGYPWTIHVF